MTSLGSLDPAFLARLETLRLSVRRVRWGSRLGGRFQINRRGSSIEFADYAAYTPGDDVRSIDWKLYARLDRLFVKTYKEEIELAVELLIDATQSMGLPTAEKFQRATHVGLCLASIGLAAHHQVRMSWVAPGRLTASPACVHRGDYATLEALARSVRPAGSVRLTEWMRRAVAQLRVRGGHVVIISDGMVYPAEMFEALHLLMRRHVEVRLIQVLSAQELEPSRLFRGGVLVDSETGKTHELAYTPQELAKAVIEHNEQLVRFCKRHGVLFAQHRLDESLEAFLFKTLTARGFLE